MPSRECPRAGSQRLRLGLLAPLVFWLQGCGAESSAREAWIDVSQGYRPTANQLEAQEPQAGCSLVHKDGIAQFRFDLSAAPWSFRERIGVQRTILGLLGYPDDGMQRSALVVESKQLENQSSKGQTSEALALGEYAVLGGTVYLGATPESPMPSNVELSYAPSRGHAEGEGWAVVGRRYSGKGLSIWPGESVSRPLEWSAGATLRFATTAEPILANPPAGATGRVSFRIQHGSQLLFEQVLEVPREGASQWHSVALPAPSAGQDTLRFSVSGDFAYSSFLAPVISNPTSEQAALGSDVIVLQVDTLRADTLAPYGGTLELAPNLERLMQESLVFRRAWSVGSYTLPAHATMMSGLYPRQVGIVGDTSRLPSDVITMAELLSAAGYRTGAVVDGGFVSQLFGMHQGFAWFEEINAGFQSTAERVQGFLDADDGRPSFLFVQTFAVHSPYDFSQSTREHFGERLLLEHSFDDLLAFEEASGFHKDIWKNGKQIQDALSPEQRIKFAFLTERMRDLYFANIYEFDAQFAGFQADLEARNFYAGGQLLLTSDHGESFMEHHALFHGNILHEEELRVPFFLYGAGIQAGLSETPVSLVDLAPTLAELCGLEKQAWWVGHSVLREIAPRKLYAFQCSKKKISTWAQIEGNKKWLGYESGNTHAPGGAYAAFDLALDPDEQQDLLRSAAWAEQFSSDAVRQREKLFTSLFEAESSADSQEMKGVMQALGYMGDEE